MPASQPDDHRDPIEIDNRRLEEVIPQLRAFVRLNGGDRIRQRESSSDIVQSVCLQLLMNRSRLSFDSDAAFRGWLFTTAHRKVVDHLRHHNRLGRDVRREQNICHSEAEDYGTCYATMLTPCKVAMVREELAELEQAMDRLSDQEREAITLVRVAGLSHAEAEEQMNRRPGDVNNLITRGMQKLKPFITRRAARTWEAIHGTSPATEDQG